MNVITWDYLGYKELYDYWKQSDWNATILVAINKALPETSGIKRYVFVSYEKLPILESIVAYRINEHGDKTLFNLTIRPLTIDNDKMYVTVVDDFDKLDVNNCGIVKIINYE